MAGRKKGEAGKPETDGQKFVRLAQQRVSMAIKYIDLVANLAGPGYEKTPEQVKQITEAIDAHVASMKERFEGKSAAGGGFRLS